MNVAGGFRPFGTAADGASEFGTRILLDLQDFLTREWRLIALMTAVALMIGAVY